VGDAASIGIETWATLPASVDSATLAASPTSRIVVSQQTHDPADKSERIFLGLAIPTAVAASISRF
jgi:hypothetical protein